MQNNFTMTFTVAGQNFYVMRLTGQEHLSQPFEFVIDVLADLENFQLPAFANATLQLAAVRQIAGVISKIKLINWENNNSIWRIYFAPRLVSLQRSAKARVFLQQSVLDIAKLLLSQAGYSPNQLHWQLQNTYSPKEYILQAPNENDFDFFQRQLTYAGIFYWCGTDENGMEKILFTDNNAAFSSFNHTLFFTPHNGMSDHAFLAGGFTRLQTLTQTISQSIQIKDCNINQSNNLIAGNATITSNAKGVKEIYHGPALQNEEATSLANLHAQLANIQSKKLMGNTALAILKPGTQFHLQENALTGNYFIVAMQHRAATNVQQQGENLTYENKITFLPITTAYRADLPALPKLFSLAHAIVESPSNTAYLNQQGHYYLRHYFDDSYSPVAAASPPVPRIQTSGGTSNTTALPEVGWHTPLLNNAEILVGCLQGDPDRPIIYGTVPNPRQTTPVTSENRSQHRWLSHNNQMLCCDDQEQAPQLQLTNNNQQNQLMMNASSQPSFNLTTQNGSMLWQAAQDITMQNEDSAYESVGKQKIQNVGQNYNVTTLNNDIQQQAQTDHTWQTQQQLVLQAQNKLTALIAENLQWQSTQQQNYITEGEYFLIASSAGQTQLQSAKNITVMGNGAGIMQIASSQAGIQLLPDGSINIFGNNIWAMTPNPVHMIGKINYLENPPVVTPQLTPSPPTLPSFANITLQQNKLQSITDFLTINLNFDSSKNQADTHRFLEGMRYIIISNNTAFQGIIRQSQISLEGVDLAQAFTLALEDNKTREALYCIAIDNQTCELQSVVTITPNDQVKTTTDSDNNTWRSRTLNITILPPVCFFNFRVGEVDDFIAYAEKANVILNENDQAILKNYLPYFKIEIDSTDINRRPCKFTPAEIAYFKENGNNATFFIHGYNVDYGQFDLCTEKNATQGSLNTLMQHNKISGTGAHQWYICMNENLNRASSQFNDSDYTKYTRVINIVWEGNPTSEIDYLAAVPLAKYPGLLTAELIKQLQAENIKVNLIAHSLGCLVAMNTLQALADAGQKLQQVFLWQAAIPANAFATQLPEDTFSQNFYYFPEAAQGAEKVTVLYSHFDNVLGPIIKGMTIHEYANKFTDPSTPLTLAFAIIFLHELNLFDTPICIDSIYELANTIGQPISWFLRDEDTITADEKRKQFYEQMRIKYIMDNTGHFLKPTLKDQDFHIQIYYYRAYAAICTLLQMAAPQPETRTTEQVLVDALFSALGNLPSPNFANFPNSISETATIIITLYIAHKTKLLPAMGYNDITQETKIILGEKYDNGDQGQWLAEHSAMKIPNEAFIEHVYKPFIFNKMKYFGRYK